jgi:3-methyladenine DNA glycosylase/8-oxoguanine DNA glycosylase
MLRLMKRVVAMSEPFDVGLTLGSATPGRPTTHTSATDWWHAMNTDDGAATIHVRVDRSAGAVTVEAWGPGRAWVAEHAPALLGCTDETARDFTPSDPLLRSLARECRGMRITSLSHALDITVRTIIEQRVTSLEARRSWRTLVARYGEPAPGPVELCMPPAADVVAQIPDWEWRRIGIEGRRSATVRTFAREGARVERSTREGVGRLDARLRSIRGIGVWTAATVTHAVLGDADAVPIGDWHLPVHVGFALAGGRDADDARMLELLEPYRPHRARVWRLIVAGAPAPERRAPRAEILGLLALEARR